MITVVVKLGDKLNSLEEALHVNQLRYDGVPMREHTLIAGVEAGVLAYSDEDGVRTYTWALTEQEKRPKVLREWFETKFRILRVETIGETWYEVHEKRWWKGWDKWTTATYGSPCVTIRYSTLYLAKSAIQFYKRGERPRSTVITHL